MERSVLVTGAASGIGKGVAGKFLTEGWNACLFDFDKKGLAAACRQFEKQGFNPLPFTGDAGSEADMRAALKLAAKTFGRLDCVVNNAGIGISKPVEKLKFQEWERVLRTNLTSIFLSAKHGAKFLKKSRGSIINISSTRSLMSEPNTEAYSASKGGVVSITHALAMSLAPVRVNCISPGWIVTEHMPKLSAEDHSQHPVGRAGTPLDIAELAFFLASEASGFITGQNIYSDGGMTKKMIYV